MFRFASLSKYGIVFLKAFPYAFLLIELLKAITQKLWLDEPRQLPFATCPQLHEVARLP